VIMRRLPVVVGLEGRGIQTRYSTETRSAAHVNLGVGLEF